ncbi:Dcp1p-Dcp2p decapping enzyme complex alpha subunit [Elasticomyces elasticus]|nr:Dcp1p-Dcp2p decapping enzyme complex alpha subunit [Elasticomyces elasticus]
MAFLPRLEEIGMKAHPDEARYHRERIAYFLGRGHGFPGAQPVSFARRHFQELQRTDYYLCEKTDGIRCLLYLTANPDTGAETHYLVDRKNDYYRLELHSLHFPLLENEQDFHTDTLVDGELVCDRLPGGRSEIRYLVFDCMVRDGQNLTQKPLDKRIGAFIYYVFEPYKTLLDKYPEELEHQAFTLTQKKFEKSYGTEMMFKDILPTLPHGNDGLVFTCRSTPYVSGTDQHIIKWKPPHENTIDFRLEVGEFPILAEEEGGDGTHPDWEAMPNLALMVYHGEGKYEYYAELHVTDDEWESMKALNAMIDGRIIECYQDSEHRWRFKREKDGSPRFRDDKTDANHISTVLSVIESIKDAVSEQDLIAAAGPINKAWKAREAEAARQAKEAEAVRRAPPPPKVQ